jgi:hypothetical protein
VPAQESEEYACAFCLIESHAVRKVHGKIVKRCYDAGCVAHIEMIEGIRRTKISVVVFKR